MAILGIDEVGRGPLAGPLVVGAVVLPDEECEWFQELNDSKKLTAKKREWLNDIILQEAAAGLGWVHVGELDRLGISDSLRLATRRAVKSVQALHVPFSQIIIDGKVNFLSGTSLEGYVSTCIKADAKFKAVSAASIIAKVARDHYMMGLDSKYPDYGFAKHVGYGTAGHVKAIYAYGLCPEHRRSFEPCKTLSDFQLPTKVKKNTTEVGKQAELAVAEYLEQQGHHVIARNHKTYFYEIDVISVMGDRIYFTEVKYRRSDYRGAPFDAIDRNKQQRMRFAAESYLKDVTSDRQLRHLSPILAVAAVTGGFMDSEIPPAVTWFPIY